MDISLDISDLRVAMSRYDRLYGDEDAAFRMFDQRDLMDRAQLVYPDEEMAEESDSDDEDDEEDEEEVLHLHGADEMDDVC